MALVISGLCCAGVVWAGAPDEPALHSLQPPVELPDGSEFKTWEVSPQFSRTYYVSQNNPHASDANPGTPEAPFLTISHAAQILQPGERVVIGTGLYRECVRPARGGSSPAAMISYEAAPDATVVITGTEAFKGHWTQVSAHSTGSVVWTTVLPRTLFSEGNPFQILNATQFSALRAKRKDKFKALPPAAFLYRGLIFQNGRRFTQVGSYNEVAAAKSGGIFWVADDGVTLDLRAFDDADPNAITFELTARAQGFAPDVKGLSYLRVQGLTVECVANSVLPQRGAICVNGGNHWIIEDNTVRDANAGGITIGRVIYGQPEPPVIGDCIVRHNRILNCGAYGIGGIGLGDGKPFANLIEDNVLSNDCWQAFQDSEESAGIKILLTGGTLIRRNLIVDTQHGPGIWIDMANVNTRCSSNVVLNTDTRWGGIFIEASIFPNEIDHNIIWNSTGAGLYQHDCNDQIFNDNLIGHCAGPGIYLFGRASQRMVMGKLVSGGPQKAVSWNVIVDCHPAIKDHGPASPVTNNITENVTATLNPRTLQLTWETAGQSAHVIDLHVPAETR